MQRQNFDLLKKETRLLGKDLIWIIIRLLILEIRLMLLMGLINCDYLEKSHIVPSHYNNELKFLMTNKLEWTDLQPDSFQITKIDNLMPQEGNYHRYNHKVLFTTIIKDQQGGYSYKMGINCYTLDRNKDYTLCIEILNSDYQLGHKSVATIDKTTSEGVTIAGFTVQV